MPRANKEERNQYTRDWKRNRRSELGLPPRGKHVRKKRTEEEIEQSKVNKKTYQLQYTKDHPYRTQKNVSRLLWAARKRAKEKGLDFDIEESDIVIPTHCPILGIPLVLTRPRGNSRRDIASLDRIVPEKGYIKGNIEVISWLANTMKNNATPELLVAFSKEMLRRYDSPLP